MVTDGAALRSNTSTHSRRHMAFQVVDTMADSGPWTALQPDGVTASGDIAIAADVNRFRFGADARSGRITATAAALDHRLERPLPNLDLTTFDALRFWIQGSRAATGAAVQPFFLELRLASAAVALDAAANTWVRLLPISALDTWELVHLNLTDLPAAIRGAVNRIRLRCTDATSAFTCNLDDLIAVRLEMVQDVEAALIARLHNRLVLNGNQVAAMFYHTTNGQPPNPPNTPAMRLQRYHVHRADGHLQLDRPRQDYTGNGFAMGGRAMGYDLYYAVEVFTQTAAQHARVLEYLFEQFAPQGQLLVNNELLPVMWVETPAEALTALPQTVVFRFKVSTVQVLGTPEPVVPLQQLILDVEHQ